jgi:hypothetical protein
VENDGCVCGDLVARLTTAGSGARPPFRSPSRRPCR